MHKAIIEDLAQDCPCHNEGWCFFRELLTHIGLTDRNAEQLRLIQHYKFMQSKKEGEDIGNERACKEFIAQYSAKFAEVYQEDMRHTELFEKVFGFPYLNNQT